MPLPAGARLGAYQIVAPIGAGGMGEVYRARDTTLRRDVAIKILPDVVARDPERLARFRREAQLLAALNHPNIAHVYGLEGQDGQTAGPWLVMELVEGPTLADRIARRATAVDEAIAIARQLVGALETAHEQGIIHRDLKPANIKVREDGAVKVLDFGLAKAVEGSGRADGSGGAGGSERTIPLTQSPTMTAADQTVHGVVLGTAAYMSPEQARGQQVGAQADIWAFGCVLYEMLSGRPAFGGATLTDTLAAVIERDPDWTALPPATPAGVIRVLRRTLEKNPSRRLHAIADARFDLDDARDAALPSARARPARSRLLGIGTAAAVLLVSVLALQWRRGGEMPSPPVPARLSIAAPGQVTPQTSVAVSPDGRRLAFVSTDASGRSMLWVRDLDALAPRVLAGTDDAAHPFWAPDGSAIGFLAGGKLKRVGADGGQALTLAEVTVRSGGSWSPAGVILFEPRGDQLATIPASGGPVSTVVTAEDGVDWPWFLPDGRHFLFFRHGADAVRGVYAGSLGSDATTLVLRSDFKAVFAPPDYLLFARDGGVVFAQHLDLERLVLTGEPTAVAEGVWSIRGAGQVSLTATAGVLSHVNATLADTQLAWFDRTGRPLGMVGGPGPYSNQSPRVSPDGSRLAIAHGAAGGVWVTRFADSIARRLTLEPAATEPVWSADASRILFQWLRGPTDAAVSVQDADGNGSSTVVGGVGAGHVWDWSPDGRWLVYGSRTGPEHASNLWILPVGERGDPIPLTASPFHSTEAQIAPDGRWIAYTSYESGRDEVYVDSFPNPGHRRQISVAGGMQPRWRRDGSELFYLAPDQMLMAMPVTTGPGRFEVGRAAPLFRTRIVPQGSQSVWFNTMYDVTPDGQQFIINGPPADPGPPITVVLNWAAGVK